MTYRIQAKPLLYDWDYLTQFSTETTHHCLTPRQAQLALTALLRQAQWRTRWGDVDDFDSTQKLVADTIYNLQNTCKPPRPGGFPLTWYYQDDQIVIDICEDIDMPVTINVYECCGDEVTGSATISGENGTITTPVSSSVSKCDFATTQLVYINDQATEWLKSVDTAVTGGSRVIDAVVGTAVDIFDPTDALNNAIETLAEILEIALDPLINAFEDSDLILRVQENWWGRAGSVRYENLTRADLVNIGQAYPVAWGNPAVGQLTSPRLFMETFMRFADLRKINGRNLVARASADESLCAYLAAQNGENYEPTPQPDVVLRPIVDDTLSTTHRFYYWPDEINLTGEGAVATVSVNPGDDVTTIDAIRVYNPIRQGASGALIYGDPAGLPVNTSNVIEDDRLWQAGQAGLLGLMEKYVPSPGRTILAIGGGPPSAGRDLGFTLGTGKPGAGFTSVLRGICIAIPITA